MIYARGEYPTLSVGARLTRHRTRYDIQRRLHKPRTRVCSVAPVPADTPTPAFNQARFLDTYVGMNFSDWQISYGNQSLWWGPSQGGALMFSDNAQPIRMFRVNRVTPFRLPSFLGVLGPMRIEGYVGQYSGYDFVFTPTGLAGAYGTPVKPQPIDHGERISFKPTSNLEIGLSRTTDYGGPGYPLTLHNFFKSVFSTGNSLPGNPSKPGARRSGLDFSYRLPGMRNGRLSTQKVWRSMTKFLRSLVPTLRHGSRDCTFQRCPGSEKWICDWRAGIRILRRAPVIFRTALFIGMTHGSRDFKTRGI